MVKKYLEEQAVYKQQSLPDIIWQMVIYREYASSEECVSLKT